MSGKNPLGNGREPQTYEGLNVIVPVGGWQVVRAKRDPTTSDKKYPVATLWINTASQNIWFQTAAAGTWTQVISSGATLVAAANGGTGVASPTAHAVMVAEGSSAMTPVGPGTNGQVLTGVTGADPAFSALGTNSGLTAHGVLLGEGNSAIAASAVGATGTVLAGNTSADPTFQTIAALNIVDNTTGTVASPTTMLVNTTYVADQATAITGFLLPASATLGQEINIVGNGPGGWQVQQNASQAIKGAGLTTTTGTGGSLSSTNRYDGVTIVCVVAGASTIWAVNDSNGTLTFV